jgi:hypothetical protein
MLLATVYYIDLSDQQAAEINTSGWGTLVGKAYWEARSGRHADAIKFGMIKPAAKMQASSAEQVWQAMQNINEPWSDNEFIVPLGTIRRSMDVGDVIVWENGKVECCADFGFKKLETFDVEVNNGPQKS